MPEKFDPNKTTISKITGTRTFKWTAILGGIGAVGGALVAVNAFTGLDLRPAWGFEVADLQKQQIRIEGLLDKSNNNLERAAQSILELNREQLELKIAQIEFDRREARRELTELQLQAEKYRVSGEPLPGFLTQGISDTEERIQNLDEEKKAAQARLINLR